MNILSDCPICDGGKLHDDNGNCMNTNCDNGEIEHNSSDIAAHELIIEDIKLAKKIHL